MREEGLPPLPEPTAWLHHLRGQQVATLYPVPGVRAKGLYTADQVRAAIEAERERLACKVIADASEWAYSYQKTAEMIAAAIRSGK